MNQYIIWIINLMETTSWQNWTVDRMKWALLITSFRKWLSFWCIVRVNALAVILIIWIIYWMIVLTLILIIWIIDWMILLLFSRIRWLNACAIDLMNSFWTWWILNCWNCGFLSATWTSCRLIIASANDWISGRLGLCLRNDWITCRLCIAGAWVHISRIINWMNRSMTLDGLIIIRLSWVLTRILNSWIFSGVTLMNTC